MLAQIKRVQRQGFTLLELLIVIAIIALLAVVIFFLLSPAQQLAKARDAGRASTVSQLAQAVEAYGSSRSTSTTPYPAEGATWVQTLVTAGEMGAVPSVITYGTGSACTTNAQNGWCYDATTAAGGGPFIVFTRLEALVNTTGAGCASQGWQVYSSTLSRSGRYCKATEPAVGDSIVYY